MRKLVSVLSMVMALMMVFMVPALAEDTSLSDIQAKGELNLGLDASFPPMGFMNDDGEIVGYDIDVARAVCEKLGVKLVCQPIDWDAKDMELANGNIDCIWNGLTVTEERQETYSMSVNYLQNAQVVVVLEDSEVQTLADLAGKTIAVQSGSSAAEAVDANEEFKASLAGAPVMRTMFFEFPDQPACWELRDQYMFGPDVLVAPVLDAGAATRTVYLPADADWTDLHTGETFSGGQTVTCDTPLQTIPVFLKDHTHPDWIGKI